MLEILQLPLGCFWIAVGMKGFSYILKLGGEGKEKKKERKKRESSVKGKLLISTFLSHLTHGENHNQREERCIGKAQCFQTNLNPSSVTQGYAFNYYTFCHSSHTNDTHGEIEDHKI